MDLADEQGAPTRVEFDSENRKLAIDGHVIDLAVFAAMINPDPRVLWRFKKVDGTIQVEMFDERKVLWLEESDIDRDSEVDA